MPPFQIATSVIASRIPGMAISASMTRITGPSRRRKNPASKPITRPMVRLIIATAAPIISETRVP